LAYVEGNVDCQFALNAAAVIAHHVRRLWGATEVVLQPSAASYGFVFTPQAQKEALP
jgi:hypothetical protein